MYNVYSIKTNIKDLNLDYTEESKDNQDALPPADNI